MNIFVIIIGFFNLILALLVGITTMFFTFKFLHLITRKIDDISELKSNNYSVAIYNASILFSVAWVVKGSLSGAVSSITLLMNTPNILLSDIFKTFGIMLAQITTSGIIAFSGVYVGIKVFTTLTTKIDEFSEIQKNNVSIAIIVSTIIIIISLFISPSVKTIVEGLVPYPSIITNPA